MLRKWESRVVSSAKQQRCRLGFSRHTLLTWHVAVVVAVECHFKDNKSFIFHLFSSFALFTFIVVYVDQNFTTHWAAQTNNWFKKLITLFFRANWVIEGWNLIKNYCLRITMGTSNIFFFDFFHYKNFWRIFFGHRSTEPDRT